MKKQTNLPRNGFTLVELLVAISIIVILVALLLPAISSVRQNVRVKQVVTEIAAIESAMADFKSTFGEYPPSRITLHGSSARWSGDNASKTAIRKIWPQFDFTSDGAGGNFIGDASVTLDGAECLVFFLGGIDDNGTRIGFSKNPSQPFSSSGSRLGPFFEFDPSRLTSGATVDGDMMSEYLDPIPGQSSPYVYLSSYDGSGYSMEDLIKDSGGEKWMEEFYRIGTSPQSAYKPKSFQVISPGFDGQHGLGGLYESETAATILSSGREVERDNITNFSGGMLAN